MNEIGSSEAKSRFSELLSRAERGEEIIITKRGKRVAKLVPFNSGHDVEEARAAAHRIRELAEQMKLGPFDWEEWKRYRDEGRR